MLLLTTLLARADISPPEGYVETCTVALQCGETEGTSCSAYFGGRTECEALEAKGWQRMCQTRGASTWSEVFCAQAPDDDARRTRIEQTTGFAPTIQPLPARRCGCSAAGMGAGWLLVPLLLLARRRMQ
ncbi:MAG: hypothetical protein P8R54_12365 [Myxococcota bacterium]|nr:hypothetical protein [Myxococcota bacterium]